MNITPTRRGSAVYAAPSMHCTAPAPDFQQAKDLPPAEQYLTGTQFASAGRDELLHLLPGSIHTRQNSHNAAFGQGAQAAAGHVPLPSSELQVADINFSPGGLSETICPSNGTHSRRASQQCPFDSIHTQAVKMLTSRDHQTVPQRFPLIERPSIESLAIGAFPGTLDPDEHGSCIAMLKDAQAVLEDLSSRVKVGEQSNEMLAAKVKSLLDEISCIRMQAAVPDEQVLRDRTEGLRRQIGYLMTIPRNQEYLGKIKLFEAEAREFRQSKFDMEQMHAKRIQQLEDDKEVLARKLKTTEHCYSTELARVSNSLQREREAKEKGYESLVSAQVKIGKLETALDHERSKVSELQVYINQQQQWGRAANNQHSENVHCIVNMLQNFTQSIRVQNQQMAMTDRALQSMLGNPVDPPPAPPRR